MKQHLMKIAGMILLVILLAFFGVFTSAEALDLEDALGFVGQGYDRIEITDDFSKYNWNNTIPYTYNEGKIVILWREAPLKQFEKLSEPVPDDYEGKDIGNPKTYLCAELMEQIPEEFRATTPEEVGNIILVETQPICTASISSYAESYLDNIAKCISTQDINKMLDGDASLAATYLMLDNLRAPDYYKPLFSTVVMVSVYNAETGGSVPMDWDLFEYKEMRSNPDAADIWDNMNMYGGFWDEFTAVNGRVQVTKEEMDRHLENIAMISEEDYEYLSYLREHSSMDIPLALKERYWEMAKQLAEQESDPDIRAAYFSAIEVENREVFDMIVNLQSYSSVSMSDEKIMDGLYYIGIPSEERMEEMLQETIDVLEEYLDWELLYLELLD